MDLNYHRKKRSWTFELQVVTVDWERFADFLACAIASSVPVGIVVSVEGLVELEASTRYLKRTGQPLLPYMNVGGVIDPALLGCQILVYYDPDTWKEACAQLAWITDESATPGRDVYIDARLRAEARERLSTDQS